MLQVGVGRGTYAREALLRISHLPPWNGWAAWIVLLMAMSEEHESKQKYEAHTQQFHISALLTSASILWAKANYMVQHRIKGQGDIRHFSVGRTPKIDVNMNEYS